ncbi:tyrosine-type recombinase/integrase [Phaeodactylibacter sp.]|uniref:tyrosine-type recombinase/integrase n=1 Tax=Phaeodactylibacter sp. TaxID=1940289 RepID=UPI0025E182AF|nr:tyrosine-type recombinase/integrase [Phaeodactylibacter sp.]MCI5093488.1 site-specific integrase [Phaeodactylibacter sp.]
MNLTNKLNGHKKKSGEISVRLYVSDGDKRRYLSTGLYIHPEYWDKKKGEVKSNYALAKSYNRKLLLHKRKVEAFLMEGGNLDHYGKKEEKGSVLTFLEDYLNSNHGLKPSTVKGYRTAVKRLKEYAVHSGKEDLLWSDINRQFYHSFSEWVTSNGANWSGLAKHLRVLKKVMRLGKERALHDNDAHLQPWFKARENQRSNKIYLTQEEISKIELLDLSSMPALKRERDRFLIAYYFLIRFSDVVRLSRSNFFVQEGDTYLLYTSVKENTPATVPVKKSAWSICQAHDFNFSFTANQVANRSLKQIASMAGITQVVNQGDQTGPKCQFVTFHTARRSGATNLRLMGASLKTIADIGGWKKLSTVEIYLRPSGMDSAKLAKKLGFFD